MAEELAQWVEAFAAQPEFEPQSLHLKKKNRPDVIVAICNHSIPKARWKDGM